MKHSTLRCTLALLLTLALALSLAACGGQQDSKPTDSTSQGSSGKLDTPKKGDPAKADTTETPETPVTTPEEPAESTFSELAQAALDDLCAHRDQQYLAVAFLGEREKGYSMSYSEWLYDTNPSLASIWPFLEEIPEEDILGDHGFLYCIVPLVESAKVAVANVEWEKLDSGIMEPRYSDPVYYGEVGKPFLMYIANTELFSWDPDLAVQYTRDDGGVTMWTPEHQEGLILRPYENDRESVIDFSRLYDVGDYIPYLSYDFGPDAAWAPPTNMGLANTSWYSHNGWLLEFAYRENWVLTGEGFGLMMLYEPPLDMDDLNQSLYRNGQWWMEGDSVHIDLQDDQGITLESLLFPILIPPSGEQLVVIKAEDGTVPPFFEPGQTCATLTLSYD